MSGGRVELGLGAGWFEAEHPAYGIPFPPLSERFDRLAEQLEIVTGLWTTPAGERYSFTGDALHGRRLARAAEAGAAAAPAGDRRRRRGSGARRSSPPGSPTEFNVPFAAVDDVAAQFAARRPRLRRRRPRPGGAGPLGGPDDRACGRDDAEVARRAEAIGRTVDELDESGLAGTVAQVVDQLGTWRERTGITRFYLQVLDLADLDHLELIAAEVAPQLA